MADPSGVALAAPAPPRDLLRAATATDVMTGKVLTLACFYNLFVSRFAGFDHLTAHITSIH
jgi:hypothetical protein